MLPFSESMKSSVLVGDMGLVGAVQGGVSGPEALGMVEPRCHEVASEVDRARKKERKRASPSLSDKSEND